MTEKQLVHVIDDEEAIRRSLDFMLRAAGYNVERWADGAAFLAGADNSVPACVLLDIRMPGIDGIEVQARMPALGFDFPVILLTGHGDILVAVKAMKAGASDFLEKPFDRERLLQSVAAAFDQIAGRESLHERAQWARTQLAKLTEREREIFDGLACGYPNKTIAYDLGISSRTVEVYRANVMNKLDVRNFADALRIAFAASLGSEHKWREAHQVGRKPGSD